MPILNKTNYPNKSIGVDTAYIPLLDSENTFEVQIPGAFGTEMVDPVRTMNLVNLWQYINSKVGGIYVLTDYGAVGNGTTNNNTAFQNAVNATPAGGTLLIPPGNFLITDTITLANDIRILGLGSGISKITFTSSVPNKVAFLMTGRSGLHWDYALISSTGRNDNNNIQPLKWDRGNNNPAGNESFRSVAGNLIQGMFIDGFSGDVEIRQAIRVSLDFQYLRGGGLFVGRNSVTGKESTTVKVSFSNKGYFTNCDRGATFDRVIGLDLDFIGEYCGKLDNTYGAINLLNCRNVILNMPYGEKNKGSNLKAIDTTFHMNQPDFYTPEDDNNVPTGNPSENITFDGVAWADRGATKIGRSSYDVLKRDGTGWVSLGLIYQGTNTFLGCGYVDNGVSNLFRTVDNLAFPINPTENQNYNTAGVTLGNTTYNSSPTGILWNGYGISAGTGDTGTRHGFITGTERTNASAGLTGARYHLGALVRGGSPISLENVDERGTRSCRQYTSPRQTFAPTGGGSIEITMSNGSFVDLDLSSATGNITLILYQRPTTPTNYKFLVKQGATPRNVIFPSGTVQAGGGGNTMVNAVANAVDLVDAYWDGTSMYLNITRNYA